MMQSKKVVWTIVSVLIGALSVWAVSMQSKAFSIAQLREFILQADKGWLLGAVLCMIGFIFFEGCALVRTSSFLGHQRRFSSGMLYSAADVYFSAITPSASGGQPASAFFMMRDGIPGTAVTVTLLINAVMHTLALFVIGLVSFVIRFRLVWDFSLISRIFIGIGAVVLLGLSGTFFLALKKGELLYGLCTSVMKALEKMHLLRNGEKKREKLSKTIADYKTSSQMVTGHPGLLLEVFFWNICQRTAQFGVSFMIFKAVGYSTAVAGKIWLIQSFVSVGSNCVPIPGSMGVADYLMLDGFTRMVGEEHAAYMELMCRGMSFYGCVLTSVVIVVTGYLVGRKRRKNS